MTYPDPQTPVAQAATIIIKRSPQTSAIKIALGIVAALFALLLGLLVLIVIGIETGPVALLLGFVAATIPVPLYIVLVLWIDRYEAEPGWMLATAFFWGALVATFFAFLLNTTSQGVVGALSNASAGEAFAAVISAPIVEETGKAFILFIFFFWKKDEFDGVVDGIVYASLTALGFAMTENILYYGKAAAAPEGALPLVFAAPCRLITGSIERRFKRKTAAPPASRTSIRSSFNISVGSARSSKRT